MRTFIQIFKIFSKLPPEAARGTDRGSKVKRECSSLEQKQSKTHSLEQEANSFQGQPGSSTSWPFE
jgi:hypothetical protein